MANFLKMKKTTAAAERPEDSPGTITFTWCCGELEGGTGCEEAAHASEEVGEARGGLRTLRAPGLSTLLSTRKPAQAWHNAGRELPTALVCASATSGYRHKQGRCSPTDGPASGSGSLLCSGGTQAPCCLTHHLPSGRAGSGGVGQGKAGSSQGHWSSWSQVELPKHFRALSQLRDR